MHLLHDDDMCFVQIKRLMRSGSDHDLGIPQRFAAGSLAGAISQTVIYPMEVCSIDFHFTFIFALKRYEIYTK